MRFCVSSEGEVRFCIKFEDKVVERKISDIIYRISK